MNGHDESRDPPCSDDASYEASDASDGPAEPRYTPEELGALFLDFYKFLTTLHYDESDLKIPPPQGWPQITPEACAHFKSDYAIQVLRHLPYFDRLCPSYIHFKSKLLDLTTFARQDFESHIYRHESWEFWSSEGERKDPSDIVCIASGLESFGRFLWLNVVDCEIHEYLHAGDMLDAVPVEEYFENLKDQYRSLKLVPGRRRITIEAENIPEREDRITEEEVHAQTEEWGTDLDVQYVRQIYRDHEWPDAFRKEEAFRVIDDWSQEALEAGRLEWRVSPPDWDSSGWT
ncbi:hypothetical protein F66182_4841 [Fusarium sp. NRRL 66182]|nr:hypothetical protein F66182_4841 [Fusarium sp. NRRL 66182]